MLPKCLFEILMCFPLPPAPQQSLTAGGTNEKTLFEKDNLDVIITNLESDHIYGSFNNLKKSTKKRI